MSLVKRNHNPFAKVEDFLYVIIDRTVLTEIKIVRIGNMRRCQLHGALLAHQGRKVIAPPIEGRGFSKLGLEEMQYLYWNTFGRTPLEYKDMIPELIDHCNTLVPADDSIGALEVMVNGLLAVAPPALDSDGNVLPEVPKALVRPKGTTTTGIIWSICDEVMIEFFKGEVPADAVGWKSLRAEASKRSDHEGFHQGTFGVQYGKWKGSKMIQTAQPA